MTDEAGSEAFDQLVGLLDYPMFVVTTRADDELAGCLVGFTSQVSIRPPRFLVGLSKRNHAYRVARRECQYLTMRSWFAGRAPERFDELVTFSDVRDLEPGHEA